MEQNAKKKNLLIGAIAAVVLVALIVCGIIVYRNFGPKAVAGAKHVTMEVVSKDGSVKTYDCHTDAEFLRQLMDETKDFSYEGTESDYGVMVEKINGESAVYAVDNAYWALYVNGEYGMYGADSQPVTDGETYSWKYEAAY